MYAVQHARDLVYTILLHTYCVVIIVGIPFGPLDSTIKHGNFALLSKTSTSLWAGISPSGYVSISLAVSATSESVNISSSQPF